MDNWIGLIKSMVRPFIIIWGFVVYGVCIICGIEAPSILTGLVLAVTVEYFGERAYLRIKQNGAGES